MAKINRWFWQNAKILDGMLLNERVEGPPMCASLLNKTLNQGVEHIANVRGRHTVTEQQLRTGLLLEYPNSKTLRAEKE